MAVPLRRACNFFVLLAVAGVGRGTARPIEEGALFKTRIAFRRRIFRLPPVDRKYLTMRPAVRSRSFR